MLVDFRLHGKLEKLEKNFSESVMKDLVYDEVLGRVRLSLTWSHDRDSL